MGMVLVAGATGALGRCVVAELKTQGHEVRRLVRQGAGAQDRTADLRDAVSLRKVTDGVDAVISCAGASMSLNTWGDRTGFREVDWQGNCNLLADAKRHAVPKFVYVSLANGQELAQTEYAKYHEAFVEELAGSGLEYAVVRPTGLFSFCLEILNMARQGRGVAINGGWAKTNPVHEMDAAKACVEALILGRVDIPVGGPEIFTRRRITEMAFEALGAKPSVMSVPGWAMAPVPMLMKPFNPRIAALAEFGIAVSSMDCVAPQDGVRKLGDYFRQNVSSDSVRASHA